MQECVDVLTLLFSQGRNDADPPYPNEGEMVLREKRTPESFGIASTRYIV